MLKKSSRHKNEGAHRSGEGGDEPGLSDPGSELLLEGRRRNK